jgi:hypothetical protein
VPGVAGTRVAGHRVTITGTGPLLALVAASLVQHGQVPLDLHADRPSLERVFLELTDDDAEDVDLQ